MKLAKNDLIWPVSHPRTMSLVYQMSTLLDTTSATTTETGDPIAVPCSCTKSRSRSDKGIVGPYKVVCEKRWLAVSFVDGGLSTI